LFFSSMDHTDGTGSGSIHDWIVVELLSFN